jgi:uncharacterized protein (DUF433 family)
MVDVIRAHIELEANVPNPRAKIKGSRIRVQDIVIWHDKLGMDFYEILHDYPTLTHADIHAALAYYWDNREEIERQIEEDRALIEAARAKNAGPLAEKLARS